MSPRDDGYLAAQREYDAREPREEERDEDCRTCEGSGEIDTGLGWRAECPCWRGVRS